jgi:hypothetical protein
LQFRFRREDLANFSEQHVARKGHCHASRFVHVESTPVDGVDLKLHPAAVIVGTVRDANGNPPWPFSVTMFHNVNGRFMEAAGALTLDNGSFRAKVPAPGGYYIVASEARGGLLGQLGYVPQYYPGAYSLDKAQILQVRPGAKMPDINFTLKRSPTFTVTVTIVDPNAKSGECDFLSVQPDRDPALKSLANLSQAMEQTLFAVPGTAVRFRTVAAGDYTVDVFRAATTYSPTGRIFSAQSVGTRMASTTVKVIDADISIDLPVAASTTNTTSR